MLIFALVALHFRAAIVPFKLFLTIVLPILFVYGLAVLVFQKVRLMAYTGEPCRALGPMGCRGFSHLQQSSCYWFALDYRSFFRKSI